MLISEYVGQVHGNSDRWFVEEVSTVQNQLRVQGILDRKEYLSGLHNIAKRPNEQYNGKIYETRKIVLQYAKTILNFQTSYLLSKPVTLSGDKDVVGLYNRVYKKGKYQRVDYDVLNSLIKYGNTYEYLYVDNGVIKSKLIDPADSYPVYDHENNMLAFIEYYTVDGVDYYNVYYSDKVEKYTNEAKGDVYHVGTYSNITGLPIVYRSENELDPCFGRSDLDDFVGILDNMEDLLSKFTDSFYKHHNPIPVVIGQQLKGDGINPAIVGGGMVLDDGSDFKLVSNQIDYKGFESIYKTLKQALLDISSTPAVSLNSQDVSNLSEVSIKLLFSLADVKAAMNEKYMRDGIEQRFEKIRVILAIMGQPIDEDKFDTLNVVFQYARPRNEQDIIDDIKTLREIGALSLESALDHSPYTNDVQQELCRITGEQVVVEKVEEVE